MQTKNIFYLIGGTPRSGKTTLAKKLAGKLIIPWISTDTLESVVHGYVPDEKFNTLFPKTIIRRETKQSNDLMYEKYSSQDIVNAYIKQGQTLEKAIQILIESENQYNHSFILEGYHVTPSLVEKLQDKGINLKAVFLGRNDLLDTLQSIQSETGENENDWVIAKTKSKETFEKIAKMITLFSATLKSEAEKYAQHYYSMDGDFKKNLI